MKVYLIIWPLFCISLAYSQNKQNITVNYSLKHIVDIDKSNDAKKITLEYPLVLIINNGNSYCASRNKIEVDSIAKKFKLSSSDIVDGSLVLKSQLPLKNLTITESLEVYKKLGTNKIQILNSIVSNKYLIEDEVEDIKWDILPIEKEIKSYNCQKAVGNFRGRQWEAWFSRDINIPSGPWKLGGLPGLILQANDNKGEVQFTFENVEWGGDLPVIPAKVIRVTKKEFSKLVQAYADDPVGFISNNILMINHNGIQFSNGNIKRSFKVPNNPIELTEN